MSNASIIVSASNDAFFTGSVVGDALFYTQSNKQSIHIGVNSNSPASIIISSNLNKINGPVLCSKSVTGVTSFVVPSNFTLSNPYSVTTQVFNVWKNMDFAAYSNIVTSNNGRCVAFSNNLPYLTATNSIGNASIQQFAFAPVFPGQQLITTNPSLFNIDLYVLNSNSYGYVVGNTEQFGNSYELLNPWGYSNGTSVPMDTTMRLRYWDSSNGNQFSASNISSNYLELRLESESNTAKVSTDRSLIMTAGSNQLTLGSNNPILQVARGQATNSNLIAYYPFDTNAMDAVGSYHLTRIGNPSYQPGMFNNAAYFPNPSNGAGYEHSWFESTAMGGAITGPPCTFACWFNMSATPSGSYQPVIFALGSNFSSPSIMANVNSGGTALIITINTTGTPTYPVNNYVVTGNTWYHLAVTYNNSNVVTYVNGSQINSTANTGNFSISPANSRLRIGAMGNTAGNNAGFNGLIDDFRVYNRALSATEVSTLYAARPTVTLSVTGSNAGASNYVGVLTPNAQQALEVGGNVVCTGNVSAGNLGMFRNRLINGDMRIAQRATTNTVTSAGVPYLSVDRWFIDTNISAGGVSLTRNALSSTTDAPYAAGIQFYVRLQGTGTQTYSWLIPTQSVEGYNIVDFNWGTTYGSYVTLSFWLRTNLAAGSLIGVAIRSNASTAYTTNITVTQPVQWQYYTITIPPPPLGTSWDSTNGTGLRVCIGLITPGATATANTWNLTNVLNTSTAANPYTNNTNYVDFTGVQLEKGTMATPFEFRPYGVELQLCHRYFWAISPTPSASTYPLIGCGYWQNGTYAWVPVTTPTFMRDPNSSSLVVSNLGSLTITYNGGVYSGLALSKNSHIQNIFSIGVTKSGGAAGANQLAALYDNTTTPSVVIYINNEL